MNIKLVVLVGFLITFIACTSGFKSPHLDTHQRQEISQIFGEVKASLNLRYEQVCFQSKYSSKDESIIRELSQMNENNIVGGYITDSGHDAVIELARDATRYSLLVGLENKKCSEFSIHYLVE